MAVHCRQRPKDITDDDDDDDDDDNDNDNNKMLIILTDPLIDVSVQVEVRSNHAKVWPARCNHIYC